ncbi:hypothetical protein Tco_0247292 [Tanacetum coccineum]
MVILYRRILGKAWYWRMKILGSVLSKKERMARPKENRVKVAEKEETTKFCGSLMASKEEVKFTHHAHLELVMHDFGKFITHVLTSRTEYDVIDIYLNDDEVQMIENKAKTVTDMSVDMSVLGTRWHAQVTAGQS